MRSVSFREGIHWYMLVGFGLSLRPCLKKPLAVSQPRHAGSRCLSMLRSMKSMENSHSMDTHWSEAFALQTQRSARLWEDFMSSYDDHGWSQSQNKAKTPKAYYHQRETLRSSYTNLQTLQEIQSNRDENWVFNLRFKHFERSKTRVPPQWIWFSKGLNLVKFLRRWLFAYRFVWIRDHA